MFVMWPSRRSVLGSSHLGKRRGNAALYLARVSKYPAVYLPVYFAAITVYTQCAWGNIYNMYKVRVKLIRSQLIFHISCPGIISDSAALFLPCANLILQRHGYNRILGRAAYCLVFSLSVCVRD